MRVLISGRHGMVGNAIAVLLIARGDDVAALVRHGSDHGAAGSPLDVAWDLDAGTVDQAALAAGKFDAIIHLAGEPLDSRWTLAKRAAIVDSRVTGTGLLAHAIAELESPPEVFAVASASGFYGDAGTSLLTEDSPRGQGFLAETVEAWETAAQPARDADIRTVHVRMGVVLSPHGGALKKLLLPFKLGLGGPIGSGKQWLAWIGLHEVARIWQFVLDTPELHGPINAVGPTPCTNREQAKLLGRVLGRPVILPIPPFAVSLMYGREMVNEMLLASQKTVPARLEGAGFVFEQRDMLDALRVELDRPA